MVMLVRRSTSDYLSGAEQLRRQELVWGFVREPPAPRYGHQSIVTRTIVLLDQHVRSGGLGRVCVSPIDVVLDEQKDLVVQPDIIFVSNENAAIVRTRSGARPTWSSKSSRWGRGGGIARSSSAGIGSTACARTG